MFWKLIKWVVIVVAVAYAALVIGRLVYSVRQDRALEEVEKIHATKLAFSDVLGVNLPPPPDNPDATVAGVDANKNGIRDDVELTIFKEYPDSAKTRAVLLQYALALQMEVTQEFLNEEIVNAVVEENSRSGTCIADTLVPRKSPSSSRTYSDIEKIDTYTNFVDEKQFNTATRKVARDKFYEHMGSYENSPKSPCDIDISTLTN